jgi:hypothetical protein
VTDQSNLTLFVIHPLEEFLPYARSRYGKFVAHPKESWKIIGKGSVFLSNNKEASRFAILQRSHKGTKYAVFIPEDMCIGDFIVFLKRSSESDMRIRISRRKAKGIPWALYSHPETKEPMPWTKSLMYQKVKKKWVLIEVDGKPV